MKIPFSILLLLLFSMTIQSQRKLNIGIEGGISLFNSMGFNMNLLFMKDLNLVIKYGEYELYGGFIETSFSEFGFQNKGYTTLGPNVGLRYHILNSNHQSHFFVDLSFSWRNYYPNYATVPLGGNSTIDYTVMESYGIEYYSKTFNSHFSFGFEPIVFNRISFPIMLGIGFAQHKGQTTQYGNESGLSDYKTLAFSPIGKIGLRFYVNKINNHTQQ
ncbi:MAG: hypothetical protein H6600_06765 [Flavobacteriales bacterium]|nr:hypothetical protein [Flavobacteriales bacterium]